LGVAGPAAAQTTELVARLSTERVAITTAFTGASILVFGSTEHPLGPDGDEVIVMARGPLGPFVVRRKVNVLGLWLNGPSARFEEVPTFYTVAGTRPVGQLLPEAERETRSIGIDSIPLRFSGARGAGFSRALVELKRNSHLWQEDSSPIEIASSRLFNFRLSLPSTVQPGSYRVEVMLVRDGSVVATEQLGFIVEQTGTAAEIGKVARGQPVVYAILCILRRPSPAGWGA
jgi:uncharacterized protein (TIGR02186 family)